MGLESIVNNLSYGFSYTLKCIYTCKKSETFNCGSHHMLLNFFRGRGKGLINWRVDIVQSSFKVELGYIFGECVIVCSVVIQLQDCTTGTKKY